jgi:hypothetical protein
MSLSVGFKQNLDLLIREFLVNLSHGMLILFGSGLPC